MRRMLHGWKVTDSMYVLLIVYFFMYFLIFRSIGVARGLTVSV